MHLSFLKRAIAGGGVGGPGDDSPKYELPEWTWIVFLLDFIILLPILLIFDYTFKTVYPVFAMVEDENPPAYEPVSLNDDAASLADEPVRSSRKPTDGRARTVTSSMRAINRLLLANGGLRANFRGFFCALAQAFMTSVLMGFFTAAFGGLFTPVATLLAALALVQLSTAWVHIVISEPSKRHFWRRLPPFKRTFDATWKPVMLYWFAAEVTRWVPFVLAAILRLELPDFQLGDRTDVHQLDGAFFGKSAIIVFVSLVCSIFLIIPANIILVRVQASLLPIDEDTIIRFDRSFEGKVEPAVVGGRGYVTMTDAWATFSRAAWRRLLTLYVKIFFVCILGVLLICALLLPEAVVIAKKSVRVE
ncbi:hypothetical protein TOPH_02225 [Tolypocladium ophioglossoides CBS 100239]|uniref:Ubiquitin carrier protein n=1 Tax=Tolypocladium ophioglossoides (strain CBS 100239) TaxID=1163406 RepID=A0A0L0NFN5_TOLOC|nr:hypothetical protein TOPH_02225 [Tolypocladium ophioglossoides CBS 100239]